MRPSRGGHAHATEGTISHLDVLRCGILIRSMSARGQKLRLRAPPDRRPISAAPRKRTPMLGWPRRPLHCAAAFGASAIIGRRIVNVDPRPTSLSTVISPPIISQNRLLIASPRPVPPYFRVVDASACENS